MKVLIQDPKNLLYLEGPDSWSADIGSALDFGNSDNAIKFCGAHGIAPVQVVLQWSGTPHSIIIPIMTSAQTEDVKGARARKHA